MTVATDYQGDYVDATYGDAAGVARTFERIIALPPQRSDNAGRMACVRAFAQSHLPGTARPRLLDIGSGLGVFPYAVKEAGWDCVALDPDARACQHIRDRVGVEAVCGDFMHVEGLGQFDVVTLNKVLEHVADPIAMLARTGTFVGNGGFVYVEVPDGEMASRTGFHREEFFIEHLHVFSFTSLAMMADAAGFTPLAIERLQEPSTKYTLRAYLTPTPVDGAVAP
jgi:SAM-dependent methyltransferase